MNERWEKLLEAVDEERKAEEAYFANLANSKTIQERVNSGMLWYPLTFNRVGYTIGDLIEISVERTKHFEIKHKFKNGASVRVFDDENQVYRGTISYLKGNNLQIILSSDKAEYEDFKGRWGVELMHDERSFITMKKALLEISKTTTPRLQNLKASFENKLFDEKTRKGNGIIFSKKLNPSQNNAIECLLDIDQLGIIHGPPGTGKTTTIVQLVQELLKTEKRVLICAPSNSAVDLIAARLHISGLKTLRAGNISRVSDELTDLTLEEKMRADPDWKHIKKVKIEAEEARNLAAKFKRSFDAHARQEREMLYKEARELKRWARDLEDKLVQKTLLNAEVICTTLINASHEHIQSLTFRTCIIDEASQAMEPACWIPMLQVHRTILVGDHMQLSPTVKSTKGIELGLDKTILHQIQHILPSSYLLDTQYRMNDAILSFSNKRFYNNLLQSDSKVANHTLSNDNLPLELIDTAGCGFEEQFNPKHQSRFNPDEWTLILEHVNTIKQKLLGTSIGIISPYAEQVRYIEGELSSNTEILNGLAIEINTIDGFQGEEKDVIYISLVRSNEKGEIGFLKDYRRMNVAMTRARKKLVMIGDFSCIGTDPFFEDLMNHVEQKGLYRSAWEFINY